MTKTANRLLANIRELAPSIISRAAEIEAGRQMPPDLVGALRSIGVFRMFVPQSYGGLELDLPAGLEIIARSWAVSRCTDFLLGGHSPVAALWAVWRKG